MSGIPGIGSKDLTFRSKNFTQNVELFRSVEPEK